MGGEKTDLSFTGERKDWSTFHTESLHKVLDEKNMDWVITSTEKSVFEITLLNKIKDAYSFTDKSEVDEILEETDRSYIVMVNGLLVRTICDVVYPEN